MHRFITALLRDEKRFKTVWVAISGLLTMALATALNMDSLDVKTKFEFDFTLRFKLSGEVGDAWQVVERLGEGGCRDALVGSGVSGQIAMVFSRCAGTKLEAIQSAIDDVLKALPGTTLLPNAGVIVCSSPQNLSRECHDPAV